MLAACLLARRALFLLWLAFHDGSCIFGWPITTVVVLHLVHGTSCKQAQHECLPALWVGAL